MYTPAAFAVADPTATLADLLIAHAATLVTVADGPPRVTVLPLLARPTADGGLVLEGHLARANPHRRSADGAPSVVTVVGAQGYISPRWYPAKAEHGRVVPTWDYVVATATGRLRVHDDADWLLDLVTRLTDRHEGALGGPTWAVSDAPDDFVRKQLRAIVGVSLEVEPDALEVKAKLSQNRPPADQVGVVAGLQPVDPVLAAAVEAAGESGADGAPS